MSAEVGATEWISEDDAIERLTAEFGDLTGGRIEAEYHAAIKGDNVRLSALVLDERIAEWRRIGAGELAAAPVLDLRLNWNDLLVQFRQQLGVPPARTARLPSAPGGTRTKRAADAEVAAGGWLRDRSGQPKMTKEAAREAVTAAVAATGPLSASAFARAWAADADPKWKEPGRLKKSP